MFDQLRGGTHLHAAAYVGKPAVLIWLLDHDVDKNRKTKKGKTALDIAIARGHVRCQQLLEGDEEVLASYRYNKLNYIFPIKVYIAKFTIDTVLKTMFLTVLFIYFVGCLLP